MTGWRTHGSRAVYENPWISVREDEVTRPDGGRGIYGVVRVRNPAVFVVPVVGHDLLLVRLFRYTIGRWSLEVPAGGSEGEDLLAAAQRELLEETGHRAETWERLGSFFSLNGVADARAEAFLARDLAPAPGAALAEEGIAEVVRVRWADVPARVADGEISDGETLAALFLAQGALGGA